MRHSNSKYLMVIGLSAALISGCACREKCCNRGIVRVHSPWAQRGLVSGPCSCQTSTEYLSAADHDTSFEMENPISFAEPTMAVSVPAESSVLNQPAPSFEINNPRVDEKLIDSWASPSSSKSVNSKSRQAELSTEESSRTYYHGPDSQTDQSGRVVVSDQQYTSSIANRESKKILSLDSSALSRLETEKSAKPKLLTPSLEKEIKSTKKVELGSIDQPIDLELTPTAPTGKGPKSSEPKTNPAESIEKKSNKDLVTLELPVEAEVSRPHNPKYSRSNLATIVPSKPADIESTSVAEANPLVLHADPTAKVDLLTAIGQRANQNNPRPIHQTSSIDSSPLVMEPINFRPLPSTNRLVGQTIPVDEADETRSPTATMLATTRAQNKRSTNSVEAENNSASQSGTWLPHNSSQPLMMQASVSKRNWASIPKLDPVTRARLQQSNPQWQTDLNQSNESNATHEQLQIIVGSTLSRTPYSGFSASNPNNQVFNETAADSNYQQPIISEFQTNSIANQPLRLLATPNASNESIPPVINLSEAQVRMFVPDQIPADNADRLRRFREQMHYGYSPNVQSLPAMDVQVSDAIRHLTVRPENSSGSQTLDR